MLLKRVWHIQQTSTQVRSHRQKKLKYYCKVDGRKVNIVLRMQRRVGLFVRKKVKCSQTFDQHFRCNDTFIGSTLFSPPPSPPPHLNPYNVIQRFIEPCMLYLSQVLAVVCVEDPADVDRMSLDLPIMKKMGNKVHVQCKSIRPIEEWVEDLKKLAEQTETCSMTCKLFPC